MGGFSSSPTNILQRARLAGVSLLLLCSLLLTSSSQSTGKKTSKGPRAVAVVEWTPSGPHLIPVSIMIDGKFYDAGLYLANPVPMALETGNVYEIQKSGDPAGLFTVNSVMQLQASNTFYAVGKVTSQADVEAAAKRAAAAKAMAAAKAPSRLSSEDGGPPRLRRAHGSGSGSPSDSKNSPPVPQNSPEPTTPAPDSTGGDDNDPDRPTLKRPEAPPTAAPTTSPAPTTASTTPPADDSDRPVLKRGSEGKQAASITGPASPKVPATPPSGAATPSTTAAHNRMEVAVSDPNSTAPHPFKWIGKPEYEERDQEATRQLALQAVRDYAAKHPGSHPGSVTNDLQVHAFDLDYTNIPLFVLTATVPQSTPATPRTRTPKPRPVAAQEPANSLPKNEFYVTVVARENYDGTMRKVFTSVTDNTHLDVYPRLELIDVVDADGSGRGELLFRQISDTSHSWVIYRVGVENLTALYNSGAPLQQ